MFREHTPEELEAIKQKYATKGPIFEAPDLIRDKARDMLRHYVRVQDLGYRWGSCGKGGWLYFHWKTILLPARIVEYVVVHELAHLHEPHHTPAFWLRVERALPDFERRRAWLSERGMAVEGV